MITLLWSENSYDVTPDGEGTYSLGNAEKDFKPVTHGQARFTKFNVADKFRQVVSPIHRPKETQSFHPSIDRSISCQTNEMECGNFANNVILDENCSQFFKLRHRSNQDACGSVRILRPTGPLARVTTSRCGICRETRSALKRVS